MSMLGQIPGIILLIVVLAISPVLASATGVLRVGKVNGPNRLPARGSATVFLLVLIAGFFVWIAVQTGYGAYIHVRFTRDNGPQVRLTEAAFTPADWAFLSTVPALAGFVTLLACDVLLAGRAAMQWLGFTLRALPRGVGVGAVGILIILPPVFVVSELITLFYNRVHFHHPDEHELLKAMKSSDVRTRVVLILAATIIAPLFEELLFRAHIQTLIRRALLFIGRRPVAVEAGGSASVAAIPIEAGPPPVLQYSTSMVRWVEPIGIWQTWLAIFLASMIFTAVHPMWMWPPLFVLAIGLGYAYERTGNLWASITMHCVFNSLSTAIYLWQVH